MSDPIKSPYPREELPEKLPISALMVIDALAYAVSMVTALVVALETLSFVRGSVHFPVDLAIPIACVVFFVAGLALVSPLLYRIQAYLAIGCSTLIFVLGLTAVVRTWVEGPAALGTVLIAIVPWRAAVFALRRAKLLEQKRAMRALQANQQDLRQDG